MATYTDQQAADRAVEIVKAAMASGSLTPVTPAGMSDPQASGKKFGEFLGSAVEVLTDKLKSL